MKFLSYYIRNHNSKYLQNEVCVCYSRCSILTLGGFRKVRFFFSFLVFPLAWKFLQLSTRPSRVSWKTRKETSNFPCFGFQSSCLNRKWDGPQSSSATLSLSSLAPVSQSPPLSAAFCNERETHSQFVSSTADALNASVCVTFHAFLLLLALFSWSPAQQRVSWSVCKPPAWTTNTQQITSGQHL